MLHDECGTPLVDLGQIVAHELTTFLKQTQETYLCG